MAITIMDRTRTKERILNATVEIIQSHGLQNATVRKVAARAKANGAAINYYFGSKNNLVQAAQEVILNVRDKTSAIEGYRSPVA